MNFSPDRFFSSRHARADTFEFFFRADSVPPLSWFSQPGKFNERINPDFFGLNTLLQTNRCRSEFRFHIPILTRPHTPSPFSQPMPLLGQDPRHPPRPPQSPRCAHPRCGCIVGRFFPLDATQAPQGGACSGWAVGLMKRVQPPRLGGGGQPLSRKPANSLQATPTPPPPLQNKYRSQPNSSLPSHGLC